MNYLFRADFKGSAYSGWQVQPDAVTIQAVLEDKISMLLRTPISIIGCGRTDAGVHGRNYAFNMHVEKALPDDFLYHLNAVLPNDIAVHSAEKKGETFHARFDALSRAYVYHIHSKKDPFHNDISWYLKTFDKLDLERMQQAASLLESYEEFYPFCKTGHDAKSYRCVIMQSELSVDTRKGTISYHIRANRFLRGMVRLITGMLVQLGLGQLDLTDLRTAMEGQERLEKALSAPSRGLFFVGVKYPEENIK